MCSPARDDARVKRDWKELAAAVTCLAFGGWLYAETFSFNVTASARVGGGIDAAGYPRLLAILTCGLALILLARVVFRALTARTRASMETQAPVDSAHGTTKAAVAFLLLLAYTVALVPVGFLIATPIVIVALLRLLATRAWPHAIAAALLVTLTVFALFRYGVNIVLPEGVLRGISP